MVLCLKRVWETKNKSRSKIQKSEGLIFIPMGDAQKAMFRPTQGLKTGHVLRIDDNVLCRGDLNFCIHGTSP